MSRDTTVPGLHIASDREPSGRASSQRLKLIIRQSCRKVKNCSAKLAAGESPTAENLRDCEVALKSMHVACTGPTPQEHETAVEAMLGPLPDFLSSLQGNLELAIEKTKDEDEEGSQTGDGSEKAALQALLAFSTEWHDCLQQRRNHALETRKAWEQAHPVQASQEHELSLYAQNLLPLLHAPSARAVSATQWRDAETSLASLQVYLLDNKIAAEQIRRAGEEEGGIEPVLRDVLERLEEWDAEGLGFRADERVDLGLVERIWGRVDKIGSGLSYLLVLDARGDEVEGVKPTTRSVFLLKSAPPAHLRFSPSKDDWLGKRLSASRDRLAEIVLSPDQTDLKRDDERRWNAAYRELEALDRLLKREADHVTQTTVKESRIEEVLGRLCAKLEALHVPPKVDEEGGAFALMYVSWELAMRIGEALGIVTGAGQWSSE